MSFDEELIWLFGQQEFAIKGMKNKAKLEHYYRAENKSPEFQQTMLIMGFFDVLYCTNPEEVMALYRQWVQKAVRFDSAFAFNFDFYLSTGQFTEAFSSFQGQMGSALYQRVQDCYYNDNFHLSEWKGDYRGSENEIESKLLAVQKGNTDIMIKMADKDWRRYLLLALLRERKPELKPQLLQRFLQVCPIPEQASFTSICLELLRNKDKLIDNLIFLCSKSVPHVAYFLASYFIDQIKMMNASFVKVRICQELLTRIPSKTNLLPYYKKIAFELCSWIKQLCGKENLERLHDDQINKVLNMINDKDSKTGSQDYLQVIKSIPEHDFSPNPDFLSLDMDASSELLEKILQMTLSASKINITQDILLEIVKKAINIKVELAEHVLKLIFEQIQSDCQETNTVAGFRKNRDLYAHFLRAYNIEFLRDHSDYEPLKEQLNNIAYILSLRLNLRQDEFLPTMPFQDPNIILKSISQEYIKHLMSLDFKRRGCAKLRLISLHKQSLESMQNILEPERRIVQERQKILNLLIKYL